VRSSDLRHHPGQISLPGGRLDASETATQAALREAWEELAVPGYSLDVLGHLTPVYISVTSYLVTPVVAASAIRPDFRPQEGEVAELIEVPARRFVGEATRRADRWNLGGRQRMVRYFDIEGRQVWGATAMMMSELAAVCAEIA
jgi:8-oxo-dGTP pyrophosphatase MutT (NUDIX family)